MAQIYTQLKMIISTCHKAILEDKDFKYQAKAFEHYEMELARKYKCPECLEECETEFINDDEVYRSMGEFNKTIKAKYLL